MEEEKEAARERRKGAKRRMKIGESNFCCIESSILRAGPGSGLAHFVDRNIHYEDMVESRDKVLPIDSSLRSTLGELALTNLSARLALSLLFPVVVILDGLSDAEVRATGSPVSLLPSPKSNSSTTPPDGVLLLVSKLDG